MLEALASLRHREFWIRACREFLDFQCPCGRKRCDESDLIRPAGSRLILSDPALREQKMRRHRDHDCRDLVIKDLNSFQVAEDVILQTSQVLMDVDRMKSHHGLK